MNEFPYDHLTSFVTKLQHGESFLTSQKIDKKELQNLIEVVKNQKVEDLKKLISNKEMTANMHFPANQSYLPLPRLFQILL